ncbi:MAG: Arm DNA-binding domain-containing protein, partial [Alphaproteobacteria bacterium]
MPKLKFTARGIAAIKPPKSGQVDYWDTNRPGFILRVSLAGRKTWGVVYRHEGRKRRLTLGT